MDSKAEIVHRLHVEAYQEGNLEVADELLADDYEEHNPVGMEGVEGPAGYKQVVEVFRAAFPDLSVDIHETMVDGDLTLIRYTVRGTHEGPLLGIDPTGNEIEIAGMDVGRVEDGELQESWVQLNTFGLLQQIDVLPDDSELF